MIRFRKIRDFLKNPYTIFVAFWSLYRLQDIWFYAGSFVSQIILFSLLLVSLRHAWLIYLFNTKKPYYFRGLELMLFMYTVYGVILFVTDGAETQGLRLRPPTFYYIKAYYSSLLPIFTCYYYTLKGYVKKNTLQIWVVIFFFLGALEYYHLQQKIAYEMILLGKAEDNVNNIGYVMLSIMPCLLIFEKKCLQFVGIGICTLFIVFSMKRGAILVGLLLLCLYIYQNLSMLKGKQKYLFVLSVLLVGLCIAYILEDTIFQNDFFQRRVESTLEGSSSGRDELYSNMISFYTDRATIVEQIVGKGADGTLKISFNYAHNDWLELLVDQGLLGVFFYFFYWFCFLRTSLNVKYSIQSRQVLQLIISYTFLQTLFSMSIGDFNIYSASILGYALADGFRNEVNENKLLG